MGTHQLSAGVDNFLRAASAHFDRICCISNDVSEWSVSLRRRFGLDRFITDWFISGDVGIRKPDPGIFDAAAQKLGIEPARITFVDDRPKNVAAASRFGFNVVLFGPQPQAGGAWTYCETFDAFSAALSRNG